MSRRLAGNVRLPRSTWKTRLRLGSAIERIAPDVVIHTAGRTPPAPDEELYRINFWANAASLERASLAAKDGSRRDLSGSAAELGPVDEDRLPVS